MSALPLTMKDRANWKRLMQEFEPTDLQKMIDKWFDGNDLTYIPSFTRFYMNRYETYDKIREKDYGWS